MAHQHNMENPSSLGLPRSAGRSRFSKALPAPPSLDEPERPQLSLPPRKDSLPSRPSLPPKDTIVRKALPIPSDMTTKMMDTPLPSLPSLARVNTPPSVVPKRKPVGGAVSVKSHPSPPPSQPLAGGETSPVESFSSLLSAYGTEDSSEARNSVETAATKYSSFEPSPPKVLPKDHLGGGITKLDLVSPLALPTPVSSSMDASHQHQHQQPPAWQEAVRGDHPPTPPIKDSQRPTTPKDSRNTAQWPVDLANNSTLSQSKQSPSQPQLLRRRSIKSDKPLTVPELKLTSSHGSTSSSQQVISSLNNDLPALPKPRPPFAAKAGMDSPIRNGFSSFPGRNIRPVPSQKSLSSSPQPAAMGKKASKEQLDGFSQYAQEIENNNAYNAAKTPQYSPAKVSPEIRRPPTPEYTKDDNKTDRHDMASPVSPMTPPEEPRPLSVIGEDVSQASSPATLASSTKTLPGLLAKTSPRPGGLPSSPAMSKIGLPRSPRVNGGPSPARKGASLLTPSPAIQPGPSSPHARSISDTSVPTIEISDDGASTIKAPNSPPRPATSASFQNAAGWQQKSQIVESHEDNAEISGLVKASPGDPNYFPMAHYKLQPIAPGTVLAPAPLKSQHLDCFANHYRFVSSRNEDHPLACQSCNIRDSGMRFTCAHCGVRICNDCRDVLMMNGRDLNKLVSMLKA